MSFGWRERSNREEIEITSPFAKPIPSSIKAADIQYELVNLTDIIMTAATFDKDYLRFREDGEGSSPLGTLLLVNEIPSEQLFGLSTGDRVLVKANRRTIVKPGGRLSIKLYGQSISKTDALSIKEASK